VYNAYALATGIPADLNVEDQRNGVLYVDLLYDLYARIQARQRIGESIRLYLRLPLTRVVTPMWAWRDPRPALAGIRRFLDTVAQMLKRKLRGGVSRRAGS
jgi:hypothetical protein